MMRILFKLVFDAGFQAVLLYRIAHRLHCFAPIRILSYMFSRFNLWFTGADIHPGAVIGKRFLIPHPVGVVIGCDCTVGDDCIIMQGVTLGAKRYGLSGKRHPRIGNRVQLYCNATALGAIEIGDDSVIAANAVVTKSVPARSLVLAVNLITPIKAVDENTGL